MVELGLFERSYLLLGMEQALMAYVSEPAAMADLVAALDSTRWAPEEFTLVGREVYLHLPSGMGRSAMVPRLALVKDATLRNWNTVVALTELLRR